MVALEPMVSAANALRSSCRNWNSNSVSSVLSTDIAFPGGTMAIPVGPPMQVQNLMLVKKQRDGTTTQRNVMAVRFVPLTRAPTGKERRPTE